MNNCPDCGTQLQRIDGEDNYRRCPNPDCRVIATTEHA